MSKETKLLDSIFGIPPKLWKNKYKIDWCDHCEVFIIICPKCGATTCNCGACEECSKDFDEFLAGKNQIDDYLSDQEKDTYYKIGRIKVFIEKSLESGFNYLNWDVVKQQGWYCPNDIKFFPELKDAEEIFEKYNKK